MAASGHRQVCGQAPAGAGADSGRTRQLQGGELGCCWGTHPSNLCLLGSSLLFSGGVGTPTRREPHLYPGWRGAPQWPAQGAISDAGLEDQ